MSRKMDLKEKYINFIKGLQLKNIQLLECAMKKDEEFLPINVDLTVEEKVKYKNTQGGFVVYFTFNLLAVNKEKETEKKFSIKAKYKVTYVSKDKVTKELFELFAGSTLILHLWPYFRQLVHDFTTRAGLPPLVLPVVKMVKQ